VASKLSLFLAELKRRKVYFLAIVFVLSCGGPEVPPDLPQAMEWHFDETQPDWKVATPWNPTLPPAEVFQTGDALRLTFKDSVISPNGNVYWEGGIYTDLPDFIRAEWDSVEVRVRTDIEPFRLFAGFNLMEGSGTSTSNPNPFEADERFPPLTPDGTEHTYRVPVDDFDPDWGKTWKQLGFWFKVREPSSLDILSVRLIPKDGAYLSALNPLWGDDLVSKIDSLAEAALAEGPGVGLSIGVKRGDDLLLAKGYGLADMENAVPATAETVYNIASVTKQFTAAAIMQLVERGKVGLDDPVTKYLPNFPNQGYEVTIRHLLTNTSGISHPYLGGSTLSEEEQFVRNVTRVARIVRRDERWMAEFQDTPSHFPPGEQYSYSNDGFNVLGMVVEEVSGVSYPEYIRAHIFGPLGLTGSPVCDERSIIPGRAQSYRLRGGVLMNDLPIPRSAIGSGGLCLTVLDLLSWNSALSEGRVVSPDAYKQMTTPAMLNDGSTAGYGFGLSLGSPGGHPVASHGGGLLGFRTSLAHFTDLDIDIVVFSNTDAVSAEDIGEIIGRWVLGLPLPTES